MLLVGAIASALAAVAMGIVTVVYFATMIIKPATLPEFLWQFLGCLLGCCLSVANLIVFLRVGNLNRDRR